jgi:hypothetical protein
MDGVEVGAVVGEVLGLIVFGRVRDALAKLNES